MSGTIRCRRALIDDAPAIASAHVGAWQTAYAGQIPAGFLAELDVEDSERRWRDRLAAIDPNIFVGELQLQGSGDVVGFCSLGLSRDDDADDRTGEIQAINLHPRVWRRGVGRELLDYGTRVLREHGFGEASLWVLETNVRACAFYEACGWERDRSPAGRKVVTTIASAELPHLRFRRAL